VCFCEIVFLNAFSSSFLSSSSSSYRDTFVYNLKRGPDTLHVSCLCALLFLTSDRRAYYLIASSMCLPLGLAFVSLADVPPFYQHQRYIYIYIAETHSLMIFLTVRSHFKNETYLRVMPVRMLGKSRNSSALANKYCLQYIVSDIE
jgi:hypothetical protein